MKKTITGYLFNRIEKLGGKEYNHIGFEDEDQKFGDLIQELVPEIGTQRKAKLTIELINEK